MPITNTRTIPANSQWSMYYDSMFARYFYINTTTNAFTYDHPHPPVTTRQIMLVQDPSTDRLPDAWIKHRSASSNLTYYCNYLSLEVLWNHPNPPKRDSSLTPLTDSVVDSSKFTKYMDPTANQAYYVNNTTFETFWELPDAGFNPGPSAAVKAAIASSAVAQSASSAMIEADLAAKAAEAAAVAARTGSITSLANENPDLSLAAARHWSQVSWLLLRRRWPQGPSIRRLPYSQDLPYSSCISLLRTLMRRQLVLLLMIMRVRMRVRMRMALATMALAIILRRVVGGLLLFSRSLTP